MIDKLIRKLGMKKITIISKTFWILCIVSIISLILLLLFAALQYVKGLEFVKNLLSFCFFAFLISACIVILGVFAFFILVLFDYIRENGIKELLKNISIPFLGFFILFGIVFYIKNKKINIWDPMFTSFCVTALAFLRSNNIKKYLISKIKNYLLENNDYEDVKKEYPAIFEEENAE